MKIFEHLTQLDNAVGFYRKGIIAILIVCTILMTAMYIHTETRILQATSSAYILNQDGDVFASIFPFATVIAIPSNNLLAFNPADAGKTAYLSPFSAINRSRPS